VVTKSKAGEAKPKAIRKVSQPRASRAKLAAPEATDAALPAEVVDAPDAATPSETPELKKKDLIAQVVQRSGVKKKFAKPVIEALLVVLGDAIAEGRELNLQPLGKVKVTNTKSVANGKVMNTRIRQSDAARGAVESTGEDSGKETLADPAE
jgi:nucleoid DNA-binding protein